MTKSKRHPVQFMDIDNDWVDGFEKEMGRIAGKFISKDLDFYR